MDSTWTDHTMQLVTYILKSVDHLSPVESSNISETRKALLEMLDNLPVSTAEVEAARSESDNSQPPQASPLLGPAESPLEPPAGSEPRPSVVQDQITLKDIEYMQTSFGDSVPVGDDGSASHDVDSYASPSSTLCSDYDVFPVRTISDIDASGKHEGNMEGGSAVTESFPDDIIGNAVPLIDQTVDSYQSVDSELPQSYDTVYSTTDAHDGDDAYSGDIFGDAVYTGLNGFIPNAGSTASAFVGDQLTSRSDILTGPGAFTPSMLPVPETQCVAPSFIPIVQYIPINNCEATGPQLLTYQTYPYQQAYLPAQTMLPSAFGPVPHSCLIGIHPQGYGDTQFINTVGPSIQPSGFARAPFHNSVGSNLNTVKVSCKSQAGPTRSARRKARASVAAAPYAVKPPILCLLPDCSIPGWNFASQRELRRHQESAAEHSSFRPICPDCGQDFSRQDAVLRHAREIHCEDDQVQL